MRRLAIILVALCLLAGCEEQVEYGPKVAPPPPRYTAKRIIMPVNIADLVEYRDSLTGETWLCVTDYDDFVTILRHGGGEP